MKWNIIKEKLGKNGLSVTIFTFCAGIVTVVFGSAWFGAIYLIISLALLSNMIHYKRSKMCFKG